MSKRILPIFAAAFTVPALAVLVTSQGKTINKIFAAFAEPPGLLAGCTDIPEAVALADELNLRANRIERYMESVTAQKAELATAEENLRERLGELKATKASIQSRKDNTTEAIRDDVDRLVALYDQMKPAEAAAILTNLPSDFAAEILMRVKPETGARIIASVEPRQAALLTAEMGARSVRSQ